MYDGAMNFKVTIVGDKYKAIVTDKAKNAGVA